MLLLIASDKIRTGGQAMDGQRQHTAYAIYERRSKYRAIEARVKQAAHSSRQSFHQGSGGEPVHLLSNYFAGNEKPE